MGAVTALMVALAITDVTAVVVAPLEFVGPGVVTRDRKALVMVLFLNRRLPEQVVVDQGINLNVAFLDQAPLFMVKVLDEIFHTHPC
jgi:hypothetical protein